MPGYLAQVRVVLAALRSNRDLQRVQLAFAGFNAAECAVWIAMLVYAYGHGGATAAGLVALLQLVPAAAFGPYAGALGDRHPRGAVLVGGYLAQGAALAVTATVLLAGAPPGLAYAFAAAAATAVTVTRPTQAALLPGLARTPEELTASNVVAGWTESVSVLLAPAATGVILALSGPGAVFAVMAALTLASAAVVAPLARRAPAAGDGDGGGGDDGDGGGGAWVAVAAGIATLRREPAARLLVVLLAAQFIAIGALDVLYVVLAIDTLGLGASWAGYLNAAFGAGGALGVAATVALVGRHRLVPALLAGIAGWAASLALLAAVPAAGTALLLLATAGVARTTFDVAGRTLLQRAAPPEVLCRVFGLLEGLTMAALAAGSLMAPLLVALGGAPAALVGLAAVLPVVAAAAFRALRHIDGRAQVPVVELSLVRSMPIFAGLPAPVLEGVARSLKPRVLAPGEVLMRQGELGDRFFALAGGTLDVTRNGRLVAVLGRGDGVGEIALLRAVPRTATVAAHGEAHVYALERAPFLAAVTNHAPADRVVEERLGRLAPLTMEERAT